VAVVGAGPSLRGFDYASLRGLGYVVAVNQKYLDLPFADVVLSLDRPWMAGQGAAAVASGIPVWLTVPRPFPEGLAVPAGATFIERHRHGDEMSDDPRILNHTGTSGFSAMNYAYLKRGPLIVLFGFDYTAEHGDHDKPEQYPWHPPGHNARYWHSWAKSFEAAGRQFARAGVSVLNASPKSSIRTFPRCTPEQGVEVMREFQPGGSSHAGTEHLQVAEAP